MATKPWTIGLIVFCTFIIATAQILLKAGTKNLSFDTSLFTNYALLGGLFLYLIGAILFIVALKYGELSVLYPVFATSYIWVCLLSSQFFPEDFMTVEKWVGVLVIILGVGLIGRGAKND